MKFFLPKVFLIVLFLPFFANAKVMFTEIAWMGSSNSTADEWLELYNNSDTQIDLSGWSINGSLSIEFPAGKKIGAHELFLLERTDDNSVPNITADYIYRSFDQHWCSIFISQRC